MCGGGGVRNNLIDLPQLQRSFVIFVVNANHELGFNIVALHNFLIQKAFDFEFFLAYSLCFVPMYLSLMYRTIGNAYCGKSFALFPSASTIKLPQACDFTD